MKENGYEQETPHTYILREKISRLQVKLDNDTKKTVTLQCQTKDGITYL